MFPLNSINQQRKNSVYTNTETKNAYECSLKGPPSSGYRHNSKVKYVVKPMAESHLSTTKNYDILNEINKRHSRMSNNKRYNKFIDRF